MIDNDPCEEISPAPSREEISVVKITIEHLNNLICEIFKKIAAASAAADIKM